MKPMLPTLKFQIPLGEQWKYEVKYDGFRAIFIWDEKIRLLSRNGKSLLKQFPEIEAFLTEREETFRPFLPLILDGEIAYLENAYRSNFSIVQKRGKLRSQKQLLHFSQLFPCQFLVFDLLMIKGKDVSKQSFTERKKTLKQMFKYIGLITTPKRTEDELVQMIPFFSHFNELWNNILLFDGEGVVAKNETSIWEENKRTDAWVKYKNWKYVSCFITAYEKKNQYFYVAVYKGEEIFNIGQFLFGLIPAQKEALFHIIKENKTNEDEQFLYVQPAICVELKYLEIYEGDMREPHFHRFRFDLTPEQCTYRQFANQKKNFPPDVKITHPEKPLWETPPVAKMDYLHYLREISPYMLPFLEDRLLTVIRFPHGMFGEERFFQKNCPDYAPDFVKRKRDEDINYIICNDLKTLIWLGNQLAIEFHIPFQKYTNHGPGEIVFDLDPPSKAAFPLAIKGALLIKKVLDQLGLISFVKTSGNKGLQIYIPLPDDKFSFSETAKFTSFIAEYLVSKDPNSFTTERLKRNRKGKLYIDYLQHGEGKTIIAPYSPRGTKEATVATPLFWDEVNEKLKLEDFQITNVPERIKKKGDPFCSYFHAKDEQNFTPILNFLKGYGK